MEYVNSIIKYKRFHTPHDPHDMKYFVCHPDVLKRLANSYLPPEVKRVIRKEQDLKLILNNKGEIVGERLANANIIYFYTQCNFGCYLYEGRKNV
jgi:hypothetical protein